MSEQKTEFRTRDRWLMLAFALGPLAALSHLTVSYTLVPTACAHDSKTMLHASTVAFLLLALTAALIGRRYLREFSDADGAAELWQERTRWLAVVAIVLGIASAVVIVAMEIPNLILGSCQ